MRPFLNIHYIAYSEQRKVRWFWDENGNTGKSWTANWIRSTHPDITVIFREGSYSNLAYQLHEKLRIIIFDWPRDAKPTFPYSFVECLLDGHVTSTKYMGKSICFPVSPLVICFANFLPERETYLSADRWDVHHIATIN